MRVEPADHFINWQQDPFANYQARLVFPEKTREFKVTVDLVAEMAVFNPFDFFLEPYAEKFPFEYEPQLARSSRRICVKRELTPRFAEFVESIDRTPMVTADFLVELNQRLQRDIALRDPHGARRADAARRRSTRRCGSCRDTGWLLVQMLRHLGLAARFVSGYLIQLTPDQQVARRPERHRSRLHRPARLVRGLSCRARAGSASTRPPGLLAGEGHIPLACTPEPRQRRADLRRGRRKRSRVRAHRCRCSACSKRRASRSRTPRKCGRRCRRWARRSTSSSTEMDVRLTMGGEPTFVVVRDRDAAEWNTDALGPTKRGYAVALMDKLRARYGAGGFLHFGQGKWYPGEQLPRWAMSLLLARGRRADLARPACSPTNASLAAYSAEDAQRFITHLASSSASTRSTSHAGLRRRLVLPVARAQAAGQRRSVRIATRRRTGARAAARACSTRA